MENQVIADIATIKEKVEGIGRTLKRIEKAMEDDKKAIKENCDDILVMRTEGKAYSKFIGGVWAVFAFVMNIIVLIIWGGK